MRIVTTLVVLAVVCAAALGCARQETQTPVATAAELSPANVVILDDSNFDATLKSGVVLVDFWATWCGPCKTQGPIVEKVSQQVGDKAVVAKLDVDKAPKSASKFGIRSIPTLIIFKDGKSVKQFVGVTDADTLTAAINAEL